MNKRQEDITIIGIESSCDDTSAAVLRGNNILANIIAGQEVHRQYGGVVPELASRAHQQNIVPVVHAALKRSGVAKEELDAVAVTIGPGLQGSLLVGASFAKSLALGLGIPLLAVNHMEAHILAHFIADNNYLQPLRFPFLCLTVSGGHTQLVRVNDHLSMQVIGETIDDAAGEAFDKAAKLLGLPYPGGPLIDKLAQNGDPKRFSFPVPRLEGLNYSFSGIKTAFLYFLRDETEKNPGFVEENLADICASIQDAIVSYLLVKVKKAMREHQLEQVAIAGGVSANSALRAHLKKEADKNGWELFLPKFEYCTDNAAMIAIAGKYKLSAGQIAGQDISPLPRMKF